MRRTYDFVVVGGGSSGCVAAAELADAGFTVLMLEKGPRAEDNPETLDADGYKYAFANDDVIWERYSEPQPHCGKQRLFMGSGSVLGGSGSVNGMVYTRGARQDWDEWPAGWRWDDVTADFDALEAVLRPNRRAPTEFTKTCIAAAQTVGFRHKADLNDGDMTDVIGHEWMSYDGQQRRSSYVAFIADQAPRPNLDIEAGAHVERIVIDEQSKRAMAVRYVVNGEVKEALVDKEVVMAAGALETPRLLMLSGVGPATALHRAGVPQLVNVPELGENLHDHPNVTVFFKGDHEVDSFYPQLYSFFRTHPGTDLPQGQSDTCYVYWPARSAMKEAAKRMLPTKLPPRVRDGLVRRGLRGAVDLAFKSAAVNRFVERMYGIVVILGKPKSRGRVTLRDADPNSPGVIDPGYFTHDEDMEVMVRGVRLARMIAGSGPLQAWGAKELLPGAKKTSDAQIREFVEKNAMTTFHYAGTARMGDDAMAPVDTRLRLRGVKGVRIVDASVTPNTPVSAMNAPSMLIGYKGARLIAADWAEHRAQRSA